MNMNKLYFIYNNNNELLIKMEDGNILIPNEGNIKSLNISLSNLDLLTSKDNQEFLFGEIHDITNVSSHFQFFKLQSLLGLVDEFIFNLAAKALHLVSWNNTYKYCSKCSTLLKNKEDERAKICPSCGFLNYPKISPAIITAVIKDKKLLLAKHATFPKERYSVIAGFVEPGETFEDCISREVFEETSIRVKNIKYFGSQPWPFPDSLMIAFICEYESGEIKVDGNEIIDASWYSVDKLPENIALKGTIARKLIDWCINEYEVKLESDGVVIG
jgi:NAD+ diphosphatase